MKLDREKAREALRHYADWDDTSIEDATLDRLEECVQPDPLHDELHAEIRRANAAEAKLARISDLFSDDVWWGTSEHLLRRQVLALLDGGAV